MTEPVITWIDEAASTNTFMARQCDALPHGAVIAARRQTAGRGQRGNSWEAQPGSNLTFSMLLRPRVILAAAQFELSMLVSLGVCDALQSVGSLDIRVKWPNDIYVGDKKICGILIENSLEGRRIGRAIAGIGINVNQERFLSDAPNPVSLTNLTGRVFDLQSLLSDVSRAIINRVDNYEMDPDAGRLLSEYRARLWRSDGFYLWYDVATGQTFEGLISDVATTGLLTIVNRDGDSRTYAFKEVAAVL